MQVFAFGCNEYGGKLYGMGETPEIALKDLRKTDDDVILNSVVFYRAEELPLKVDVEPRIVVK